MIETRISEIQLLIDKASSYFMPAAETTFFDVGMRGHYENPTTDLLAFFLDPVGQHNLGDSFSQGLLASIGLKSYEAGSVVSVSREVAVESGRIDLIVEYEQMMLVVECKIYHHQNNPFEVYEAYSNKFFPEKQKRFVILSIDGKSSASGWQGLSYRSLVENTRVLLGGCFSEQFGSNKWAVLANDFLLHLDNFGVRKMSEEQFGFVGDNFLDIAKIKEMEINFYDEIRRRVSMESGFEDVVMQHQNWQGKLKVLRFKRTSWNEFHDCALALGGTEYLTIKAMAWIYADGFYQGDNKQPLIDRFSEALGNFVFKHKGEEKWRGERWWYCEWDKKLTIDEGVSMAACMLKALDFVDCKRNN